MGWQHGVMRHRTWASECVVLVCGAYCSCLASYDGHVSYGVVGVIVLLVVELVVEEKDVFV